MSLGEPAAQTRPAALRVQVGDPSKISEIRAEWIAQSSWLTTTSRVPTQAKASGSLPTGSVEMFIEVRVDPPLTDHTSSAGKPGLAPVAICMAKIVWQPLEG